MDPGCEVAEIADLLPREPCLAQGLLFCSDELGWGRRAVPEERGEARVDRPRRLGRELLADDGADQGAVGVVGTAAATGRVVERADALHERGHGSGSPQSCRKRKPASPSGCAGSCARVVNLPAEEELGCWAHHLRVPHRLERKLGVHRLDALDAQGFSLDLLLDQIPHRAHWARQGECDVDVTPFVVDADVVDQTELHEVHPDLGVYDVPELVPHSLLGYHALTSFYGLL